MVACTGAVVVASENSSREALLTLTLKTEAGDQYLLPLSERTTRQLQVLILSSTGLETSSSRRRGRRLQQHFNRGG
jgi:hypothetical protein